MQSSPSLVQARGRRGFTLVELLVAVGLTSIMLWGILQLFSSATRFSSTVTAQAELCASARTVLDRMVREVQAAATLDTGYLKIIDATTVIDGETIDTDTLQFVGRITDNDGETQLGHIRFDVDNATGMVRRNIDPPDGPDGLDESQALFAIGDAATFGLRIDGFNIRYIPVTDGATTQKGVETSGTVTFREDAGTQELRQLPLALILELRCSDPQDKASVTLTSSAPIAANGL
jgi:prepilin-type N-terminal cleavage/methylation domain-containing protein